MLCASFLDEQRRNFSCNYDGKTEVKLVMLLFNCMNLVGLDFDKHLSTCMEWFLINLYEHERDNFIMHLK